MATKTTTERIAEMTGETPDAVKGVLMGFHNNPRLKRILEANLAIMIEEKRQHLEKCGAETLQDAQGVVKGLRNALASLNVGMEKA